MSVPHGTPGLRRRVDRRNVTGTSGFRGSSVGTPCLARPTAAGADRSCPRRRRRDLLDVDPTTSSRDVARSAAISARTAAPMAAVDEDGEADRLRRPQSRGRPRRRIAPAGKDVVASDREPCSNGRSCLDDGLLVTIDRSSRSKVCRARRQGWPPPRARELPAILREGDAAAWIPMRTSPWSRLLLTICGVLSPRGGSPPRS